MKSQHNCPTHNVANMIQAWSAARCRWGQDAQVWVEDDEFVVGVKPPEDEDGRGCKEVLGSGETWSDAFRRADRRIAEVQRARQILAEQPRVQCPDDDDEE
ncbi:MAG: hypothetical protein HY905_07210 [Deltaproteobacteria bacterium]|nr:hypothetical protein [Deltaproteobacteria bacterium]